MCTAQHVTCTVADRPYLAISFSPDLTFTRHSSGDEIANVNFLYDDIVHALKIQWTLAQIPPQIVFCNAGLPNSVK